MKCKDLMRNARSVCSVTGREKEVMQKFTCFVVLGLGVLVSGCATNPPSGLTQAYGDEGWRRVSARGDTAIWVNRSDPFSYFVTKAQDLRVVVPNKNDWLEVYDDNKIAVNVNWARKRIWNRSKQEWHFTTDPTEQTAEGDK